MAVAERIEGQSLTPARDGIPGRAAEIVRLEAELDAALRSRSCKVLSVVGPAGVGRSTLLRLAGEKLASRNAWGCTATASRSQRQPWGLLQPLVRAGLEDLRPRTSVEVLRELKKRLDEGASGAERRGAVVELLHRIGRETPFVLLLDDVDAADEASLSILKQLIDVLTAPAATRAPEESLAGGLIVLAARDDSTSPDVAALLQPWPSLVLTPLDLDGVRQYLTTSEAAQRAFELTGGVPAKLEELFRSGEPVDFTARRLERLSAADTAVLRALAVVDRPVETEFVATLSGRTDAASRLTRLAAVRSVVAQPGAGKSLFALARESERRALLDGLAAAETQHLHRAAGQLFESRREMEAAFGHFAAAADVTNAVRVGLAAAERLAQRHAWENAEALLSRLIGLGADARTSQVWLVLAHVREQRADFRGALAALGYARAKLPPGEGRAIRARAARLCLSLGAPRPAERLARAVLATGALDGAADARVALAEARFLQGAYEEALTLARATDVPVDHQLLLGNVRGKALLTLGRLEEARDAFHANAEAALRAGNAVEHARGLLNVGVVAHRQGAREEARAAYRASLAAGSGHPFSAIVHANLSSLALEEGEAEEALTQAHRALSAFVREGRTKEQAHATQNLARVYLYLGDVERAHELTQHAEALAQRVGDPYLRAGAQLVEAEVRASRGEDVGAAAQQVAAEFKRLGNPRYWRESLLLRAHSHLRSGDHAAAHAALEEARAADVLKVPALTAEWQLLTAEIALAEGKLDEAASAIGEARAALVAAPQLELPARLYLLSGLLAERRGDSSLAQAERLRAVRIIEELAQKVPPERRALFLARASRRSIFEAAGLPRAMPVVSTDAEAARPVPEGVLVGQSPAIVRLNALLARLGPSSTTVLLRGESGTGKELAARALHANSGRRGLPLVAVNCGALSEELLLSELFGHERGAFTGAIRERKGRFELADGGTIFLDEIGDISPRAQVALLRVLQERTFERVGGTRTLHVDVRVICATNRNLEELMAKGQFREDLYYRLRGASLTLPPLRERAEDLPTLCAHFFARYAQEHGEAARTLSPEARRLLAGYRWPGNVRELFNVLESAVVMSHGRTVGPEAFELFPEILESQPKVRPERRLEAPGEALDFYTLLKNRDVSLKDLRQELDFVCISQALAEGNGNISEAARLLKMKRSRLSQIVNAEPQLRALCRGGTGPSGPDDEED